MQECSVLLLFEADSIGWQALAVAARTSLLLRAPEPSGIQSLIAPRAAMDPPYPDASDLLRLSMEGELVDDLLADLSQALEN